MVPRRRTSPRAREAAPPLCHATVSRSRPDGWAVNPSFKLELACSLRPESVSDILLVEWSARKLSLTLFNILVVSDKLAMLTPQNIRDLGCVMVHECAGERALLHGQHPHAHRYLQAAALEAVANAASPEPAHYRPRQHSAGPPINKTSSRTSGVSCLRALRRRCSDPPAHAPSPCASPPCGSRQLPPAPQSSHEHRTPASASSSRHHPYHSPASSTSRLPLPSACRTAQDRRCRTARH